MNYLLIILYLLVKLRQNKVLIFRVHGQTLRYARSRQSRISAIQFIKSISWRIKCDTTIALKMNNNVMRHLRTTLKNG